MVKKEIYIFTHILNLLGNILNQIKLKYINVLVKVLIPKLYGEFNELKMKNFHLHPNQDAFACLMIFRTSDKRIPSKML